MRFSKYTFLACVAAACLVATVVVEAQASWLARLVPGRYTSAPTSASVRIGGVDYRLTSVITHEPRQTSIRLGFGGPSVVTEVSSAATLVEAYLVPASGSSAVSGVFLESVELMQGNRVVFQTAMHNQWVTIIPQVASSTGFYGRGVSVPSNFTYSARLSIRTPSGVVKVEVAAPVKPPVTVTPVFGGWTF